MVCAQCDHPAERQKVTRKLKQVQRKLEGEIKKKERKQLEKQLAELRVDLNYILVRSTYCATVQTEVLIPRQHYPKLKKYKIGRAHV